MSSVQQSPALEILVREPDCFSIWAGPPFPNSKPTSKLEKTPCTSTKFSEDGSKLLVTKPNGVVSIYNCKSLTEIRSFEVPNLLASTLSPCGTYLQTFQKSSSPQEKNVMVWNVESGVPVYQLLQKNMSKTTWPSIQFSSDESTACRMVTNEIHFFDPKDFSKGIIYKLRVPGVASIGISKAPGSYLAAFVPEAKGMPASVQIYSCNKDLQTQPLARRSFFRCSSVQFHWNKDSFGVLFVAQSDVDKTNQSYYGETKLNYLTVDGLHEGLVSLKKEGPVHDVQWSISGSEFAVVYGFMPAKATIFDKKCKVLVELGEGPYNTIRWNPKGRLLCLAGFGNLPGNMAFWDCSEKRLLGSTKAECSVTSEWSPDGHYFMTATTAPRLQIDNCVKIFHCDGSLYFTKMFDRLYQAEWKPEAPAKFGEINGLVKSLGGLKIEEPRKQAQGLKVAQPSSSKTANVSAPPAKPAAYRPPHAKNAAVVQQELFGGLAASGSGEMSKNALRNKKRREKQREKNAAEASGAGENDN
ncbi:Eukaryotic translation initiation factor eIF2A family protein [Rhynchospora pubera]|uniref:Eukaryotic translation initiation factor 2A n=1 Tax=Rhynchospora pubera TaxID=906938 RepID=A0AAV8FHI2_9POAL|nr:Eukaryotic translation initiation factor eIF2A family protein [Rhynchospora pubera]